MEENLSIGTKLNSFENELDNSKTLQEVSKNIINLHNCNFLNEHLYSHFMIHLLLITCYLHNNL